MARIHRVANGSGTSFVPGGVGLVHLLDAGGDPFTGHPRWVDALPVGDLGRAPVAGGIWVVVVEGPDFSGSRLRHRKPPENQRRVLDKGLGSVVYIIQQWMGGGRLAALGRGGRVRWWRSEGGFPLALVPKDARLSRSVAPPPYRKGRVRGSSPEPDKEDHLGEPNHRGSALCAHFVRCRADFTITSLERRFYS